MLKFSSLSNITSNMKQKKTEVNIFIIRDEDFNKPLLVNNNI